MEFIDLPKSGRSGRELAQLTCPTLMRSPPLLAPRLIQVPLALNQFKACLVSGAVQLHTYTHVECSTESTQPHVDLKSVHRLVSSQVGSLFSTFLTIFSSSFLALCSSSKVLFILLLSCRSRRRTRSLTLGSLSERFFER